MTPTDQECRSKNGKTGRKDKTCRSTELTKRGNIHRGCMCIFKLALTLESGTGWLATFSCKLDDCEMTDVVTSSSWGHVTNFFLENFYIMSYNFKNARNGKSASKIPNWPSLRSLE